MLPNALVVTNAKGGAGKTTAASQIAGIAAASGWKVLIIDADPQGNLERNLGYIPDGGRALAAALRGEAPLVPLPDERRENLWYVSGGDEMESAMSYLSGQLGSGNMTAVWRFREILAPVASEYDLIVIDSSPREVLLRRMLLRAARFVVVPTEIDGGSIDGLGGILTEVNAIAEHDGDTNVILGVIVFRMSKSAAGIARDVRADVRATFGTDDMLIEPMVRDVPKIAREMRQDALLATEYEVVAEHARASARPWYKVSSQERRTQRSYSGAAAGLAQDWQELAENVLARYAKARAEIDDQTRAAREA